MSKPRQVAGGRAASAARPAPLAQLAPRDRFLWRVAWVAALAATLVAATLAAGVVGYHFIAKLSWLASFHQAALLLSGMGPVEPNLNDAGRAFESIYALFCGVVLLGATGILFSPVIHRLLHRYHIEDGAADQ